MSPSNRLLSRRKNRGFALIVTLSLMILLTIIAVGLLSLSSISLRSSSQGAAMAEARANARLALMIALGDLQKHAGPDQRITAPAGVLGTFIARQQITGVWQSKAQDQNSQASDFTAATKQQNFKRWLVSNPNARAQDEQEFASAPLTPGSSVIDLVSERIAVDPLNTIKAVNVTKVPVAGHNGNNTQPRGRFAYAVLDEGVKARINIGTSEPKTEQLADVSPDLGSGQRPSIERIDGIPAMPSSAFDLGTESGRALQGDWLAKGSAVGFG